jgi:hypothetical protein
MNTNTPLQLKHFSEKNAKLLASNVTKFLEKKGIKVPHTMALELAGSLCGFANWQGLKAAIAQKMEEDAQKPNVLCYEDFLTTFKPLKNHLVGSPNADGFGFETFGVELEFVREVHDRNPRCVWTCVEGDGTSWIIPGLHFVNRLFYFVTNKPAKVLSYQIAYGHDEGDLCFELSVLNPETQQSEIFDTRYGACAEDVLDSANIDYTEEVDGVVEEGQSRVIIVKQII